MGSREAWVTRGVGGAARAIGEARRRWRGRRTRPAPPTGFSPVARSACGGDREGARGGGAAEGAAVARSVEPRGPVAAREHDDLPRMIGRDVGAGFGGEQGERLAMPVDRRAVLARHAAAPQPGDAEPCFGGVGERPFMLALRLGRAGFGGGRGEFVKSVDRDQAPPGPQIAAVGAIIVDQLAALPRPAPAALDGFGGWFIYTERVGGADDERGVGDADAVERREVRQPLGKEERDL